MKTKVNPEEHAHLRELIAGYLGKISAAFKPGAMVTCIVRNPEFGDDASVVVTNDTFADVIRVLSQMAEQRP